MSKNKFENTEETLEDYGELITDEIVDLLESKRKNASHKLVNSIDFDVVKNKIGLQLVIDYIDYGDKRRNKKTGALEGNVIRGRRAGQKQPPVDDIIEWIKQKRLPITGKNRNARSTNKQVVNKVKGMAFAIAKSISKNGIKAFDFLKPYEDTVTSKKYKEDLTEALLADGYANLQKPISSFNKAQLTK